MSDYDFIFEDNTPPKSSSILNRLMVVVGGLATLTLIAVILFGVILKPDTAPLDTLARAYAVNQDLIAISKDADKELTDTNAQGLATGSRIILASDGQRLLSTLVSLERQVTKPELAAVEDARIRANLETALTVNRYNEVFVEEYTQKLRDYATILQRAYGQIESASARTVIEKSFQNIIILIGDESEEEDSSSDTDSSTDADSGTDADAETEAE